MSLSNSEPMTLKNSDINTTVKVRETEILATDTRQQYREKIARITLDAMVQFVGLLDAKGTVLEINHVALSAVGISLSEVEGKPFWNSFWWQVSEEINGTLRSSIARAADGEFVRWDTPIYGRAGGKETIIIDASLAPSKMITEMSFLFAPKGVTSRRKKPRSVRSLRRIMNCKDYSNVSANSMRSRHNFLPTSATSYELHSH